MRKHPSFSFLYFHNFERLQEQEEELEKEEKRKTTIYERRLYRLNETMTQDSYSIGTLEEEEEDIPLDRKGALCDLFIVWDGLWCPCCGHTLRANPMNTVKREFIETTNDEQR